MRDNIWESNNFEFKKQKDERDHDYKTSKDERDSKAKFYMFFIIVALTTLSLSTQFVFKATNQLLLWGEISSWVLLAISGLGALFELSFMIKNSFNKNILTTIENQIHWYMVIYSLGFILQVICRSVSL